MIIIDAIAGNEDNSMTLMMMLFELIMLLLLHCTDLCLPPHPSTHPCNLIAGNYEIFGNLKYRFEFQEFFNTLA
jgi:hypothetical protein